MDYVTKKFGVDPGRLEAVGMGASGLLAHSAADAGAAQSPRTGDEPRRVSNTAPVGAACGREAAWLADIGNR